MRRTSLAALLALPVLLVFSSLAHAHPPKQCFSPFGFGGFCPGIFSKLHQHGPLFNYGPYYGYPPFEPYGPWNQYLQYTGGYGNGGHGGGGHGHGGHGGHGDMAGRGGICTGGGAGCHSSWLGGGWFHGAGCASCGHTSLFHGHGAPAGDCTSCQSTAFNPATTNPVSRYAGAGAPSNSAIYYAGLPTIQSPVIATAGGYAK